MFLTTMHVKNIVQDLVEYVFGGSSSSREEKLIPLGSSDESGG